MDGTENDLVSGILSNGPLQSNLLSVLTEMKEKGKNSEVIRECSKALKVYPNDISLRRLLSECYFEVGFNDQGESELTKITEIIDDLVSVYKFQVSVT